MAIISKSLPTREQFDLRMSTLPANSIVNVKIVTDKSANIVSWSVGEGQRLEVPYELDVTEEKPE